VRYRVYTKEGIEVARSALLERRIPPDLSQYEVVIGLGDPLQDALLSAMAVKIRKLQADVHRAKLPPEDLDRKCFDVVHSMLPRDELMLSDMSFWSRLAIKELSDVIQSRFPGRLGRVNLDNFGLGSRRECWPYKLWVRGELSFDPSAGSDRYAIGRLGGVDIWTSHVHRQNFMSIRQMFRTVLEFQYPMRLNGKPLLFEGEENSDRGHSPGFRTLIRRLRENWASVEYSILSESEAQKLVQFHATGLHRADGKTVLTDGED
jgi:hypothetical protein